MSTSQGIMIVPAIDVRSPQVFGTMRGIRPAQRRLDYQLRLNERPGSADSHLSSCEPLGTFCRKTSNFQYEGSSPSGAIFSIGPKLCGYKFRKSSRFRPKSGLLDGVVFSIGVPRN